MGLLFKVRMPRAPERRKNLPGAASFQGKRKTEFDEARYGHFILANPWNSIWGWQVVILCKGLDLNPAKIARAIRLIWGRALFVQSQGQLRATHDPDDNKVFGCALEGGAESLVAGNTRHFPKLFQGMKPVPARQFLEILATLLE